MAAIGLALAAASLALPASAQPQSQAAGAATLRLAQVYDDAPPRRRPRVRIYREDERGVVPSYDPGPDAVRDCTATYVQEYRPSGTVITPRVNCYWRRG